MPPPGRNKKGENNQDGFNYQLYTLLYLIDAFRKNKDIVDYKVGKGESTQYGALDDVVFSVKMSNGHEHICAIQAKQSNDDKKIFSGDLWEQKNNKNFNVLKYFESYLTMKKHLKTDNRFDQLEYMIMWTTYGIGGDAEQFFEEITPTTGGDFLSQLIGDDLGFKRMKIANYELKDQILDSAHPLSKTVDHFVDVLFAKNEWKSQKAAKPCYRIMTQQVFDCSGPTFRQEFIDGKEDILSADTLIFRRIFERTMNERFKKENLLFEMKQLNGIDYKQLFLLKVGDQPTKNAKNLSWNINEEDVPTENDLKHFLERFIFFVNVPKVEKLREILVSKYGVTFEQINDLVVPYAGTQMASKEEIDAIYALISLRNLTDFKMNSSFKFMDDTMKKALSMRNDKYICVDAPLDVECSTLRVMEALEAQYTLKPFLVFRFDSFVKHKDVLLSVVTKEVLLKNGLKSIIISSIDYNSVKKVISDFSRFSALKIIFVGQYQRGNIPNNCVYLKDEFDIRMLSDTSRNIINNRYINIFGKATTAGQVFAEDLFDKNNHELALKLFWNSGRIDIGEANLTLDPYFSSRLESFDYDEMQDRQPKVISDEAGTGKTTELTSIALQLRESFVGYLVVLIDCKTAIELFHDSAVEMICAAIKVTGVVEQLIVKEMLRLEKVFILVDSVDEVSKEYSSKLEMMISEIHKLKLKGLYLATRPYKEELKILDKIARPYKTYTLKPFSEEEQLEYLEKRCKIDDIQSEDERTMVKNNLRILVKTFHNIFKDKSLLGTPLQMNMIATIFEESIKSSSFEPPQSYQIGSIFEKFMQRKFDMKQGPPPANKLLQKALDALKETFQPDHALVAYNIYKRRFKEASENFSNIEMYGLVKMAPSISFIHDTFYNYFLALYFLIYHTDPEEFERFMKANLCPNRINLTTKFMDYHIGTKLRKLLGNRVLDSSFQVSKNTLLYEDKIREFNHYLCHYEQVELFDLIRKSFNTSAFNVFEVLYDSLNDSVKNELKFRFGGDTDQYINLKRLGCDQTTNLLRIMLKKRPTTFVRSFLINFPEDEEDFLEVACRKPFLEVLQWLSERMSYFDGDDRSSLNIYFQHKMSGYFKTLVQHNNASVLNEVIHWAMNNFDQHSLQQLVRENDLIMIMAANIEKAAANKILKLDDRLKMVEVMSNFYSELCGSKILITEKCLEVVNEIEHDSIRDAFKTGFNIQS